MTEKPTINWINYRELEPFIMTVNCKYCGTALPEDHEAVIAQFIEDSVSDWGSFASDDKRWGKPVNHTFSVTGLKDTVKVIAKKLKPAIDEMEEGYYHGESEYPQGTVYKVFVVLQVGDKFFKKEGSADSYGEVTWNKPLTATQPKIVTATVWE